jgi:multiple sugar transport system permease protein
VTFPAILGPLTVALILRMIEAFKVFDIIYVMTRGGPADSTKTVSFFVYQESFAYLRAGSGASYAVTVTLTSAAMIAAYIMLLRRRESAA